MHWQVANIPPKDFAISTCKVQDGCECSRSYLHDTCECEARLSIHLGTPGSRKVHRVIADKILALQLWPHVFGTELPSAKESSFRYGAGLDLENGCWAGEFSGYRK